MYGNWEAYFANIPSDVIPNDYRALVTQPPAEPTGDAEESSH